MTQTRVLLFGCGVMGQKIAAALLRKRSFEIVGAVDIQPAPRRRVAHRRKLRDSGAALYEAILSSYVVRSQTRPRSIATARAERRVSTSSLARM